MEMSSNLMRLRSLSQQVVFEEYALAVLEQGSLVGGGLYQLRGLLAEMEQSEPEI
jgi:hypothetical protein